MQRRRSGRAARQSLATGARFAHRKSELHEAGLLRLDSSRARQVLGWQPRWTLQQCLTQTLDWHLAWQNGDDMRRVTLGQLNLYRGAL